jgi:hypothetical protein
MQLRQDLPQQGGPAPTQAKTTGTSTVLLSIKQVERWL